MAKINNIYWGLKKAIEIEFKGNVVKTGSRLKVYVPGVDRMAQRKYQKLEDEIESWCDANEGVYVLDCTNGDTWCWTLGED